MHRTDNGKKYVMEADAMVFLCNGSASWFVS